MKPSDDRESAAVFEFVDDYAADLEAGRTRTLAEYLARHRGFDAAIAREYLRLRGEDHAHATPHAAPDSAPVAEADERRIGHYRMIRELGRGGQGSVWLAEDVRFARKVALKVLASRFESVSEDRRARFRREAEVIARLEHPGICPIYDADIDCDTPWIAMRLVEGQTLAQLLTDARAAVSEGRTFAQLGADAPDSELTTSWPPHSTLDVHRTLLLFERAARALHAAHEAGVIHRDFKPGNVIVTPDGKPVVLDFGLAREVGTESAQLTESGEIFGTPAYMSPEQLRGASDELDRRTDVYSLGVALYESLTLVRPFETQNNRAALFAAIQFEPAADPRALNAALTLDVKVVLDTALEKDRARRYATALELAEDLRRIREYEPIRARPAGMVLRFGRWTRRHPALAGALGVLVVSFVVTVALLARVLVVSRDRDDKAVKMLAALDVALGKHLAQRAESLTQEDPSAALVLGIRAVEQAPGDLTRAALFSALDAAHLAMLFDPDRAGIVKDLALSHDETRLALACSDGTVQVFDARTGTMLFALGGPSASAAVRIAWSADDTVLAAGHGSGDLVCWDVDARRETGRAELGAPLDALVQAGARFACRTSAGATFTIDSHAASARPLADTPVDGLALAASGDGVLVWRSADAELELHAGDALFTCRAGARLVAAACARASEGWRFFAGTSAGNVEFLDEDGTLSAWWSLPAGAAIESVSASADGAFVCVIAGSASQRDVIVLDATARERFRVALDAGARPRCAAFSPRDGLLAVSASDRTLHIVDPRGRDGREYQQRTLSTGFYLADEIEWSRDARMLFTRPNGPYAHAWYVFGAPDLPVAPHARALDAHVSADGGALVWATARGTIESAPLAAIAELAPRACEAAGTSAPLALPVSAPDGESWACARADEDGARWTIVRYAADARPAAAWSAAWPVAPQTRAFLAPGGRALATISAEGRVHLAHESAPEHDLGDALASTAFASAAFDEHGARVALGARDGRVLVLDSVSGAQLAELVDARARGAIAVLAFRPGGDELAAFGDDTFVRSWNIADGTRVRGDEQLFPPRSLAYSRDGGLLLATGSAGGGAVRVFALAPFAASKLKTHHKQDVTAAEFSADGRFLLSAARDGSVFVRESRTGELFARRTFEGGAVIQAHFDGARENPRVVSVMQDGSVRVWPIDPLPAARARFQRGLDAWEIQREQMLALPLEFR